MIGKLGRRNKLLLLSLTALVVVGQFGCTRRYFRQAADREVADILHEKDIYPQWKIEQYHVYPDPRARFADPPGNLDRPAMPADDEAAWKLSPHPQRPGCAGVASSESTTYLEILKAWDAENRASAPTSLASNRVGPIQSLFSGPQSEHQGFMLRQEQAVELGLINSREYQSAREDLYMAALPVTQQRFSFAWQWAAMSDGIRQWAGPLSSRGQQNNWTLASTVSFSKLFSTGALLTMSFANSTVFNFTNSAKDFTSASTINLNFVQPLLQGGGKAVTLEPLTQAERNLLYTIRAYARFREQFYSSISLGSNLPNSLAALITSSSGVAGPISTLAALGIAATDVSGTQRGYLPTLYRELNLAVDRKYVKDLEAALRLYEGFQEGGQVAPLQVDQVRSTLLQARNDVLRDNQDRDNALDQLKLQLGVPANLPLVLDDTPARPITRQLDRYYQLLADSDAANKLVDAQDQLPPEKMRAFLLEVFTKDPLVRGTPFQKKIPGSWESWSNATDKNLQTRLEMLALERRRLLDAKTDLEMKGKPLPPKDADYLREAEFESDLGLLEQSLRRYEAKPWEKNKAGKIDVAKERIKLFRLVSYAAEAVLVWARNDQVAQAGQSWPTLPSANLEDYDLLNADLDAAQEFAVQAALTNRWDLMNARAQVVDAWRQLAVTANNLLGVLNVQYHLDSRTPPGGAKPLSFSSAATNQELIINAQLPLVRVTERNNYRTALIDYERARRNLMGLEDSIAAQVRFDVRQLHLFAANYKIQMKVLESLYSQVENSLEVIKAPVDPDQLKASATAGAANAAALTSQYLSALNSLNGAQTNMYRVWLSYLATRMQLFQDLERLPLDFRGVWTDEFRIPPDPPEPATAPSGLSSRPRFLPPTAASTLEQ